MKNLRNYKIFTLRIRRVNKDIFEAIKLGKKKVETRASSPKYSEIKAGDVLVFVCGEDRFEKRVKKVGKFKNIKALLKNYKPQDINSKTKSLEESEKVYYSFPSYREKIKKYGLVAFEL